MAQSRNPQIHVIRSTEPSWPPSVRPPQSRRRLTRRAFALDHYRPSPAVVVIVARGEVDASNADTLTALVRDFRDSCDGLIFDFSAIDFLNTQGLRALDLLDYGAPRTALVASPAVARLLELCDTAPPIPRAGDVSAALTQVQTDRPALHLVGGTAADPVVLLDSSSS